MVEKGHGRIETRTDVASSNVDWIVSERSYPGQPRFKNIKTILKLHARAEYADRCTFDTHYYISSAPLDIERIARGARDHWRVESMHWLLDVEFKEDLSRYRTGHGAKNMAIVRRFALGLMRANKAKGSVKTRRKTAGWSPEFLLGHGRLHAFRPCVASRNCEIGNGVSPSPAAGAVHVPSCRSRT